MRHPLSFLVILASVGAHAQDAQKDAPQQVVVKGSQTDTEAGRDFIAGKIIIGKQRIADSGMQNVGEVLRSEPAISIGKDGRLGLMGLAGYTQVLVDGHPPRNGDPMALDLIHVERIEIIKSATAATGPFGIAGTINIIRRQVERQAITQLRLGAITGSGQGGENIGWSTTALPSGAPFSYMVSLSASRRNNRIDSTYLQLHSLADAPLAPQLEGARRGTSSFDIATASSQFTWTLDARQKISFSPDMGLFKNTRDTSERRSWQDGTNFLVTQTSEQPLTGYGLPLRWSLQSEAGSRYALQLNTNRQLLEAASPRSESGSAFGSHLRRHDESRDARNAFLDFDFNTDFDGGHEVHAGAKFVQNRVTSSFSDLLDGAPDNVTAMFGKGDFSRLHRMQVFAQDDWRIDRSLSLSLGAVLEQRSYRLEELAGVAQPDFRLWSPSLHLAKKINGDSKRQLRLSLARTYQAPETDQLFLRPRINTFAPCAANLPCQANTVDTPDSVGNPALQPERALGLNVSYAHGVGANSEITLEFYTRRIAQKTGKEVVFESVAWASVPRYLMRPVNLGEAKVEGLSLEARLAARDFIKTAPQIELSGSAGLARSELSTLPGPDNRLDGQYPWRAKLALNYTLADLPVKMGFDANLLPGDWIRNNVTERVYQARKLSMNANANWKLSNGMRLSLNAENLLPENRFRVDEYRVGRELTLRQTTTAEFTRLSARLEMSL